MKDTAVIIVNWNGKKYLQDCLGYLRNQTFRDFKIILADNGSADDSVFFVEENFPEVEIIKLDKNTGFAYPNNLGISKAIEDKNIKYIITLNNDTKVDAKYIEEMVNCAKRHPEAGSVQPKVINFYEPNIIDSAGILVYFDASAINRGQKESNHGQYEKEEEIFGASAALYAREALEKIKPPEDNYFDNDYFAYEDVDLAWRLRLAGFKSFYCPKAKVYHIHSATGKSYSPFKSFHIHRNHYYNIIKNLPLKFMLKALAFMPIRYLLLISSILRKNRSWWQIVRNIPMLIKKRNLYKVKNMAIKDKEFDFFK